MADITSNGGLLDYVINAKKQSESGELSNYPDPADPSNVGTMVFTEEQFNVLVRAANEILNRFNQGGGLD